MHSSRISTLMIDSLSGAFEANLDFWSGALGLPVRRRPGAGQRYVTLGEIPGPLMVRLQRVDADPGFHLDIETDRVAAEVRRLSAHGASGARRVKRWWVMADPSGNPFCVIRPESAGFPGNARRWDAEP